MGRNTKGFVGLDPFEYVSEKVSLCKNVIKFERKDVFINF